MIWVIYGATDRYRRKILWLQATRCNMEKMSNGWDVVLFLPEWEKILLLVRKHISMV